MNNSISGVSEPLRVFTFKDTRMDSGFEQACQCLLMQAGSVDAHVYVRS